MAVGPVEALASVAGIGPFFEVSTDPAQEVDPTWRPLADLEPADLRGLVADYATRLGTAEQRVAASILFQSLAARLWSPPLACAAEFGVVPDLKDLHWRWIPGAAVALWLPSPRAISGEAKDGLLRTVVEGKLQPLVEVFTETVKVAEGLLWGNAASALVGTLRPVAVRPGLAAQMSPLVGHLLEQPPLKGTWELRHHHSFVRRSCCLYYRVPPGGGYCADCPLNH